MDYIKQYEKMILKAQQRDSLICGERHHILPQCIIQNNIIVKLTFKEHYYAHYFLMRIFENTEYSYKLIYAFRCMNNMQSYTDRYINSRLYEESRLKFSQMISESIWITDGINSKRIPSNLSYPDHWYPGRPEEVHHKIAEQIKGTKHSLEHIKKNSDSQQGRIHITDGINEKHIKDDYILDGWYLGRSESSKKKISIANLGRAISELAKYKIAQHQTGTFWVTNNKINKKIKNTTEIPKGWRLGLYDEFKTTMQKTSSDRIYITDGVNEKHIKNTEKIIEGWWIGKPNRTKQLLSKLNLGEKNPNYGKKTSEETKQKMALASSNRIWLTNGIINSRVKIDKPIQEGWYKGFTKKKF